MSAHAATVENARQRWNDGDLDGYLALYGENVRLHGYAPTALDKPAVVGFYQMIWGALTERGRPSPQLDFHEVLVDGDHYCCRFTMTGAHNDEFMGVPATGRAYSLDGITIMRFRGRTGRGAMV